MNIQEIKTAYQTAQEVLRARYGHLILQAIQREMIERNIEKIIIYPSGYAGGASIGSFDEIGKLTEDHELLAEVLLGCSAILTQEKIERRAGAEWTD